MFPKILQHCYRFKRRIFREHYLDIIRKSDKTFVQKKKKDRRRKKRRVVTLIHLYHSRHTRDKVEKVINFAGM